MSSDDSQQIFHRGRQVSIPCTLSRIILKASLGEMFEDSIGGNFEFAGRVLQKILETMVLFDESRALEEIGLQILFQLTDLIVDFIFLQW
jgi:hypothetical protein